MPAFLSRLSLAAMLFASSSAVSAQVAPLILQCKWNGGDSVTYKIATDKTTADAWARWDADARAWSNFECAYEDFQPSSQGQVPGGPAVIQRTSCSASADSVTLQWSIQGIDAMSGSGNLGWDSRLSRSYIIYRETGKITIHHLITMKHFDGRTSPPERFDNSGTCEKAADPSLSRKPAPPKPKF